SDITYPGVAIGSEQKRKTPSVKQVRWSVAIEVWPYRIDWFDVVAVMCGLIISAIYSCYIDYSMKDMSIGILIFIMGWMVMEWFMLGDEDHSIARTPQKELEHREPVFIAGGKSKRLGWRSVVLAGALALCPAAPAWADAILVGPTNAATGINGLSIVI